MQFEEPLYNDAERVKLNHSENLVTSPDMNEIIHRSSVLEPQEMQEIKENLGQEEPKSIRQTGLRWLMLTFGCIFLMGSYFCYDIPGVAQKTFEDPPYNLTALQVNEMYIVYSVPNLVLPLAGGIFLDKIGIR